MPLEMTLEQIRPNVRIALEIFLKHTKNPRLICSRDHRIFYVTNGCGKVQIGREYREVKPGRLFFWMSGTPYCFLPDPGQPLRLLTVNFDFTQEHAAQTHPLPVISAAETAQPLEQISFPSLPVLNAPLISDELSDVVPWLRTMIRESDIPQLHSRQLMAGLLTAVLSRIAQGGRHLTATTSANVAAILDYVNRNYRKKITNREIAQKFGYHPNYVSQLVRTHTGVSLHRYLLQVRIRHAVHMLENTQHSVEQIAELCGFCSSSYFCEYFKQATGFTPGDFRLR